MEHHHRIATGLRAVIFDFDGTLAALSVDFKHMRSRVLGCIRARGLSSEPFEGLFALEMVMDAARVLAETDRAAAERFREEAMAAIRDTELAGACQGRVFDGVPAMFEELRNRNIKTAVVTRNCREAVLTIYPAIEDHTDILISRDGLTRIKPDPRHLMGALELLNIPAEKAVIVGDHPMDIETGKAAGTRTVGVLTGLASREMLQDADCDLILDNATDILELVYSS